MNVGIYPPPSQYASPPRAIGGSAAAAVPTPMAMDGTVDWRKAGREQWPKIQSRIYETARTVTAKDELFVSSRAKLTSGSVGTAYLGAVLLPSGKVFICPVAATPALIYDPANDTLTQCTGTWETSGSTAMYNAGVLLRDGRVFSSPRHATTARIWSPSTDSTITPTGTYAGSNAHVGSVVLPDGRVFLSPFSTTSPRIYDPVRDTLVVAGGSYPGVATAYMGCVLIPDGSAGKVYMVPRAATTARIYDAATDTAITPSGTFPGNLTFAGGVLMADGRIFCVPSSSSTARIYDWQRDTLITPGGTYPTASNSFIGGALLPDGRIFCIPCASTTARIYDPVRDTVTTPAVTFPGSFLAQSGCAMADGRILVTPSSQVTPEPIRIYNGGASYPTQDVPLSPFYNHF